MERIADPLKNKRTAERKRLTSALRSREEQADIKEIGPLPKVQRKKLRDKCATDLVLFGETYFAGRLYWKLSASHIEDAKTLQRCVLEGGQFAYARPRGEGKSVWSEIAAIWATVYGYRHYVLICCANDKPLAQDMLFSIQSELEQNDELLKEFPEVCYPIRRLDGVRQKASGQTLNVNWNAKTNNKPGPRTRIEFRTDGVRYPVVINRGRKAKSSGAIIETVGLTGAIRGRKANGPNGEVFRPDFVILDDPQTRESAKSPTQTADRMAIIRGDVLGLAGARVPIAVVMPCTVIYPNDLADQFLDRTKFPQWQGRRTKRLTSWPKNMQLWEEYREVRANGIRNNDGGAAANEFYKARRFAMDLGASVSWDERIKIGDVSAIQGAMNRWIDDPEAFFAEDQNEPRGQDAQPGTKEVSPAVVMSRYNGLARYEVPEDKTRITAFVDIGAELHFYCVVAFNESFGASVIDYGTHPPQNRPVFAAKDAALTKLSQWYTNLNDRQRIYASLSDLVPKICDREYEKKGGGILKVDLCLIDSGWESQAVYQYIRASAHANILHPSKGFARTTTAAGVGEWKKRQGERRGFHWRLTQGEHGRIRAVQFDPDAWKSAICAAWLTAPGGTTGLTVFGTKEEDHRLYADHQAAEYSHPVTIRGTTFDKWEIRPHRPDNHYLDVTVGAFVAASVLGIVLTSKPTGEPTIEKQSRRTTSFAEQQAEMSRNERTGTNADQYRQNGGGGFNERRFGR